MSPALIIVPLVELGTEDQNPCETALTAQELEAIDDRSNFEKGADAVRGLFTR